MAEQTTIGVRLDAAGSDAAELAELTAKLRRELLQLDVDAVEQSSAGAAPEGSKAIDMILIGSLVVTLGRSAGRLADVVRTIQGWVGTGSAKSVKLELDGDSIEITGGARRDQQKLIDLWIERHAAAPGTADGAA